MKCLKRILALMVLLAAPLPGAELPPAFPPDSQQSLERTCFQTGGAWSSPGNLRSDVAIVYGIDPGLPNRIRSWRDRGYRIHVMTGVSWGQYQDYLYGRFDGVNHEDEAQTERSGKKVSHGGDVYYMCPGTNYGKFLCVGVRRALNAGAEAIHLEEPEFWVRSGYSEGFKREWRAYYGEAWQPPHSSADAQWRASKLKYFLYRRALQQVFDYVQAYNARTGRQVRCYVPTHSLLNYAHWQIVSPESSLALLNGCDGYIAQVWTGTARSANVYRGQLRERTFETAFLEYGAMQNLVRATGRRVWYLNDPVEDNPDHDWEDYRTNWESTLVASLFQPEVWRYEVAPWPERIFDGKYPRQKGAKERVGIPPAYATELQTVMHSLNDLNQASVEWDCGTQGLGVLASDSLMFQRGNPDRSDPHLSHFYGLAMPLLKRGMPVNPVQLENLTVTNYLDGFRVLILSYHGMKPLSQQVHLSLANWVKNGGWLVFCDDDTDPYRKVREWWNTGGANYATPRQHLFELLGAGSVPPSQTTTRVPVGNGGLFWVQANPVQCAATVEAESRLVEAVHQAATAAGVKWRETNHLLLRRGPYLVAAGLEESLAGAPKELRGHLVNLFDPDLRVRSSFALAPGTRFFLLDLDRAGKEPGRILASACKALPLRRDDKSLSCTVEGVAGTPAVLLIRLPAGVQPSASLAGEPLQSLQFSASEGLLWVRFTNLSSPRQLSVSW